ncbi:cell division protein PerM [Dermabacteraceae bacterium CCM 9519]
MSQTSPAEPQALPSPLVLGIFKAVKALLISAVTVLVPVLAATLAAQSDGGSLGAFTLGLSLMLLGHGSHLYIAAGPLNGSFAFLPLGLTAIFYAIALWQAYRGASALDLVDPERRRGIFRDAGVRDAAIFAGSFTAVYIIGMLMISAFARTPDYQGVFATVLFSGLVAGAVCASGGVAFAMRPIRALDTLPHPYAAGLRGSLRAIIFLLGAACLGTLILLAVAAPKIYGLQTQLAPGMVGGVVLTLIQLVWLPVLVLWVLTVGIGGQLSLGQGNTVSLAASEPGVLPAFPILGALPGPAVYPGWVSLLLLVPFACVLWGVRGTVIATAELDWAQRGKAYATFVGSLLIGLLILLATSRISLGEGRLHGVGPLLGSVAGPILLGSLLALGIAVIVWGTPLLEWLREQKAKTVAKIEKVEGETEKGAKN